MFHSCPRSPLSALWPEWRIRPKSSRAVPLLNTLHGSHLTMAYKSQQAGPGHLWAHPQPFFLLPLAHSTQITLLLSTSPDIMWPPFHLPFWNVLPFICHSALFLTFGFLFKTLFRNHKFLSCTYYPPFLLHCLCSSYYYSIDYIFNYLFVCLTW